MKKILYFAMAAFLLNACQSAPKEDIIEESWDFENGIEGWRYYSQDTASIEQWAVNDGILAVSTRANTYDRSKLTTLNNYYGPGVYRWRTFIPEIAPGDQVSIGSWLYRDDHHELDFEVGYGTAEMRQEANAQPDEVVAAMTNQDFPYKTGNVAIKPGWHDFEIRLEENPDGKYTAVWAIDGTDRQTLDIQFGPEVGFTIHVSVENLKFLGDTIPQHDYTGLYDHVSFKGKKATETKQK